MPHRPGGRTPKPPPQCALPGAVRGASRLHRGVSLGSSSFGLRRSNHYTHVHLNWVRFFSAGSVRGFLQAVASQLCSANHDNWAAAQKQIDTVMLDVAWDAMNFSSIHNLLRAQASDERATHREVQIHQGCEA